MSWFSKKEEKPSMPELPELPDLPELPEPKIPMEFAKSSRVQEFPAFSKEDMHALPTFPNSETANKMSRAAIKSAFEFPPKTKPYTQEMDFRHQEEEEEAEESISPFVPQKTQIEPIFVRIDKFQSAMKNISEIRKQVSEIESYLSEIRKIRAKEEEELQEWEREILEAKSSLDSVDKTLFSKI